MLRPETCPCLPSALPPALPPPLGGITEERERERKKKQEKLPALWIESLIHARLTLKPFA